MLHLAFGEKAAACVFLKLITGCHFLLILSRDAGPKCPVDNERLNESQVIIDNSMVLDTTY